MKRVAWTLTMFGVLAAAASVASAAERHDIRVATYGPYGQARIEEVHHHGHEWYHGGWGPVVLPPRVYVYPAPTVVVPAPVYPPVYPAPGYYYYGYPAPSVQFQGPGVSLGIGL
jgi:hypothetical protein